ncbi:transcriptional regulator [Bacillus sp. OxB-1]|uniref:TetR/AcrR family transcriptional regulator n=1 Tax=Bacillus sp. (strain OxB-1) TaxID=98228 RepID=UPI0005820692|nr:TetR/AcrR family transcriptional regulator [Bacillus sp. OxB-1]BAQ09786.1 transcriptional regulator [Bacillus sp. OxB-1]
MNERKRQVLLTAQRLFVEKGFNTTSIQDILDAAKISKGTFYNYFSSKNECLIAILEQAHIEAAIRRKELLIGQEKSDKDILARQISVRLVVNKEHNLLPIYEAVFYSRDEDLRAFIRKLHLTELRWITDRLVDVYGQQAAPYASDGTVMLVGMMQQYLQYWSSSHCHDVDTGELVAFCIRRLDAIMEGMQQADDRLIDSGILQESAPPNDNMEAVKNRLVEQLSGFLRNLTDDSRQDEIQYTRFLLDEIGAEHPRLFILETVARSFRETFNETRHEPEANELLSYFWKYLDLAKKFLR